MASGVGIVVLPRISVTGMKPHTGGIDCGLFRYVPFDEPVPDRLMVLAWRESLMRTATIEVAHRGGLTGCEP